MKALLICPSFFGYEKEIEKGLEKAGYSVDFFDEKPYNNAFFKVCVRIFGQKKFVKKTVEKYFYNILNELDDEYDIVLVVKGEALSKEIVIRMKEQFSCACFIFYAWDSLNNYPHVKDYINLFDKLYTFDDADAKNIERMNHLPLFYSEQFYIDDSIKGMQRVKPKIVFAGTVHSDRYRILGKINKKYKDIYDFDYFMFFPSLLLFFRFLFYNFNDIIKYRQFGFNLIPKSRHQLRSFFQDADCIIDIQHPAQNGLTMRTIEIMPLYKKLITTNVQLENYSFYDKNNYLIIDRDDPVIPITFLASDFNYSAASRVSNFSIDNWIQTVCHH